MSLVQLPGLGPKSTIMLANVGIYTLEDLTQLGSVAAYLQVKRSGANASLNLLWALEGVLSRQPWQTVAKQERLRLLLALDDLQKQNPQGK